MLPIDKLAWIHIHAHRVLCARSRGRDAFFLPGGKREAGESDEEALRREVREELGVTLIGIKKLHVFEAQAHGQPEGVDVRMTCFTAAYAGEPKPGAEIEEMAWLAYDEKPRLSLAGQLIFDWLRGRELI